MKYNYVIVLLALILTLTLSCKSMEDKFIGKWVSCDNPSYSLIISKTREGYNIQIGDTNLGLTQKAEEVLTGDATELAQYGKANLTVRYDKLSDHIILILEGSTEYCRALDNESKSPKSGSPSEIIENDSKSTSPSLEGENSNNVTEIERFAKQNWKAYKDGKLASALRTTVSGLRYIIHDSGVEGTKPTEGEQVSVHYYGILDSDGKMFDTSFKTGQPYQFPLGMGQVIPGLDEGIMLLNKGSKATLFIPASLGYGAAGSPPVIPENADLIFYIELEN